MASHNFGAASRDISEHPQDRHDAENQIDVLCHDGNNHAVCPNIVRTPSQTTKKALDSTNGNCDDTSKSLMNLPQSTSIDSDLIMVTPVRPLALKTPIQLRISQSPPPPPNSERLVTAIRQAENTLNAAILDFNTYFHSKSAVKVMLRHNNKMDSEGETNENSNSTKEYVYSPTSTTPESGCSSDIISPVIQPMLSSMRGMNINTTISQEDLLEDSDDKELSHFMQPRERTRQILDDRSKGSDSDHRERDSDLHRAMANLNLNVGGPLVTSEQCSGRIKLEKSFHDGQSSDEDSVMVVRVPTSRHRRVIDDNDSIDDYESDASSDVASVCDGTNHMHDLVEPSLEHDSSTGSNPDRRERASDLYLAMENLNLTVDCPLVTSEQYSESINSKEPFDDAQSSDEESVRVVRVPTSRRRRVIEDDDFVGNSKSDDSSDIASVNDSKNNTHTLVEQSLEQRVMMEKIFNEYNFGENVDIRNSHISSSDIESVSVHGFDGQYNHDGSDIYAVKDNIDCISLTQDNDDNLLCFDGCGCWTLDKQSGDLYLPPNSDTKWPRLRLPLHLYQKLYQHQRIGVQWMASLHRNTIKGGILADDMGMGKTMQVLAYLGSLLRARTISNAMIVSPKSVVRTWEREANLIFNDVVPNCSVVTITSDIGIEKRMQFFTDAFCSSFTHPHIVITTYGLVSNHITELNKIASDNEDSQWCYVVLDEGHCIKNLATKISKDVRLLCRNKNTRRLLLTGTPIQNHLRELYSLFDWATSGNLLGSLRTFINNFAMPIENGRQKNASEWTVKKADEVNKKLQQLLRPYFLQRLKATEFQAKLPTKRELVVFVSLAEKQRELYEKYLAGGMIRSVLSGETSSPLAAIAYLKQLCGHPSLIREARDAYNDCDVATLLKDCAKLDVLLSLVQRLKCAGHRALIFSQSTKMLDIMERVFDDGFVTYLRIDGRTAEKSRQKAVDHFNDMNSGVDVMLLSTKAAGVGLTLNGANRTIIYDPSWNPAEDAQAIDRCYRIGQTKNVTVYRMLCCGTVEEKMYEKQVHKDGIRRVLLSEFGGSSTERYFDLSELRDLFKLTPPNEPCSMMTKFNDKSSTHGVGSSGKPSFLSRHPKVVGVASHDMLYSQASNISSVGIMSSTSAAETPFSRSPFKTPVLNDDDSNAGDKRVADCKTSKLKPLSNIMNHKERNSKENDTANVRDKFATSTNKNYTFFERRVGEADNLISNNEYAKAMDILLELIEKENHLLQRETKLQVHEKISFLRCRLGWL